MTCKTIRFLSHNKNKNWMDAQYQTWILTHSSVINFVQTSGLMSKLR